MQLSMELNSKVETETEPARNKHRPELILVVATSDSLFWRGTIESTTAVLAFVLLFLS